MLQETRAYERVSMCQRYCMVGFNAREHIVIPSSPSGIGYGIKNLATVCVLILMFIW